MKAPGKGARRDKAAAFELTAVGFGLLSSNRLVA